MNNPAGQGGAGRATKDLQDMLTRKGVVFRALMPCQAASGVGGTNQYGSKFNACARAPSSTSLHHLLLPSSMNSRPRFEPALSGIR
jgi:hypothetical protein